MGLNRAILTLLNLKGIGPSFVFKNRDVIVDAVRKKQEIDSILFDLGKSNYESSEISSSLEAADTIISTSLDNNINILNFTDLSYPKQLRQSNKYPIIYTKGMMPHNIKICGIIGSRESTEVGEKIASKISTSFQKENFYILTGLAEGIDRSTYSIRSSDSCRKIIGVLPGGLMFEKEKTLSRSYSDQAEIIKANGGILISPFPPSEKQDKYKLSEYCKLQANLSDILILIQSKIGGGSRFTVEEFCKLERKLGVINGSLYERNKDAYEANTLIINNPINGLGVFTGNKLKKIICQVIEIKSKGNYKELLNSSDEDKTLFD